MLRSSRPKPRTLLASHAMHGQREGARILLWRSPGGKVPSPDLSPSLHWPWSRLSGQAYVCACECVRLCGGAGRGIRTLRERKIMWWRGLDNKGFLLATNSLQLQKYQKGRPGRAGDQFLPTLHRPAEWGLAWPLGGGRGDLPRINI